MGGGGVPGHCFLGAVGASTLGITSNYYHFVNTIETVELGRPNLRSEIFALRMRGSLEEDISIGSAQPYILFDTND